MARRPTVYEVAEKAGVSIATVSFAFSRPERVKTKTREHVLAVAEELGYVPSGSARGLAVGRTSTLGLFAFDLFLDPAQGDQSGRGRRPDPAIFPVYVDEIQRGFELECWTRGLSLLLSSGPAERGSGRMTDVAGRVDGLAIFPGPTSDRTIAQVARHVPVVLFNRPLINGVAGSVSIDNAAGVHALLAHLVDHHGYDDLGFVGPLNGTDQQRRFEAFVDFMTGRGLSCGSEPLSRVEVNVQRTIEDFRDAVEGGQLPRVLMCATDQIALVVMEVLKGAGVRVPDDVAITGFDGILAGELMSPSLTTVRQPMEAMGREAVKILSAKTSDNSGVSRVFTPTLVVRGSCGCVQGALP